MPKYALGLLIILAFIAGCATLVTGLFIVFGAWALVGCGVALLIPILFLDIEEESDNG